MPRGFDPFKLSSLQTGGDAFWDRTAETYSLSFCKIVVNTDTAVHIFLRHRDVEHVPPAPLFIRRFLLMTSGHSEGLHSGLHTGNLVSPLFAQGKVPGHLAESALAVNQDRSALHH